jgi:hypothetical protein
MKYKPNFLIVGAPKCGTTALYRYLQSHPEVFMPKVKEPYYFIQPKEIIGHGPKDLSWRTMVDDKNEYYKLFQDADSKNKAIGEASAGYLYFHKESIPKIKAEIGDPKIIILIRNPIERAFSSHIHHVRAGRESISFMDAWMAQKQRKEAGWWFGFQLRDVGLYSEGISAFQKSFSEVMIIKQEDLLKKTNDTLAEIYKYLNLSPGYFVDIQRRFNENILPRSSKVKLIVDKFERRQIFPKIVKKITSINSYKPILSIQDAQKIAQEFEEDLKITGKLCNKDLSGWLNKYI